MLNSVAMLSVESAEDGPQGSVSGDVLACPSPVHVKRRAAAPDLTCSHCDAKRVSAGTLMGLSQHSTLSLEDVAAAAPECSRWFQLYILKDRALTADILRRYRSFCSVYFSSTLKRSWCFCEVLFLTCTLSSVNCRICRCLPYMRASGARGVGVSGRGMIHCFVFQGD